VKRRHTEALIAPSLIPFAYMSSKLFPIRKEAMKTYFTNLEYIRRANPEFYKHHMLVRFGVMVGAALIASIAYDKTVTFPEYSKIFE